VPVPPWTRCSVRAERRLRALRAVRALAALLLIALAPACKSSDPARAAAERFVDQYYVEIDLPAAREEASGLARDKVEREMKLLEGVTPAEAAVRPSINYRFLEQQDAEGRDRRGFLYELTITFNGGDQVLRRALVTVREDQGAWHAVNFQEID
jgi:hypothetical protein